MMMAMQLAEEFSARIGSGQTLTEDEVLAYNQSLVAIKTYMRWTELNYVKAIQDFESENPEEGDDEKGGVKA